MPNISDNAGDIYEITSTLKPGDTFSLGVTNVSYIVQDEAGNTNGCTFHVIVKGKYTLDHKINHVSFTSTGKIENEHSSHAFAMRQLV